MRPWPRRRVPPRARRSPGMQLFREFPNGLAETRADDQTGRDIARIIRCRGAGATFADRDIKARGTQCNDALMRHGPLPERGSPPAAKPTGLDRSAGGLPPVGHTGGKVSAEHSSNSQSAGSFLQETTQGPEDRAQKLPQRCLLPSSHFSFQFTPFASFSRTPPSQPRALAHSMRRRYAVATSREGQCSPRSRQRGRRLEELGRGPVRRTVENYQRTVRLRGKYRDRKVRRIQT
jgi:hypothetical protein